MLSLDAGCDDEPRAGWWRGRGGPEDCRTGRQVLCEPWHGGGVYLAAGHLPRSNGLLKTCVDGSIEQKLLSLSATGFRGLRRRRRLRLRRRRRRLRRRRRRRWLLLVLVLVLRIVIA